MFSLDNLIEKNGPSVEELVQTQPAKSESERIGQIFETIEQECRGDDELEKYYEELVVRCYEYTEIVLKFNQVFQEEAAGKMSEDEYREALGSLDASRLAVHNATIDSFNVLARLMAKRGRSNEWAKPLASGSRAAYGKYAIQKTIFDIIEHNKQQGDQHDNHGQDGTE